MAEQTYFTSVIASVAGANKHHLTLWNGAGSGKTLKIFKIVASPWPTAAVTGLQITLLAARISTQPTGGTPKSIGEAADADPGIPTQVVSMAAPTNVLTLVAPEFGVGTVSGEETSASIRCPVYEYSIDGMKPVDIGVGLGLTVRQGALAAAGAVSIVIFFTAV